MEQRQRVEITYKCDCCGSEFHSGRARHVERLCQDCIEIRRCLRPFIEKRGLTVGQVLTRAGKLLLSEAKEEAKHLK